MANDLLTTFTDRHLPAFPEPREPVEPAEPQPPRDIEVIRRSPEEVAETWQRQPVREESYRELTTTEEPSHEPAAAPEQRPAAAQQITNAMIAEAYAPAAKLIIQDLIKNCGLEEDFADVYPHVTELVVGQMRFAFDKIFEIERNVMTAIQRLEQTITFLHSQYDGQLVVQRLNQQFEALARKDGFAGLRDPKIRADFTNYLVGEGATAEQLGKATHQYLAKKWQAFNSPGASRRFVAFDGGGSRLLEKMIRNSGRL